MGIWRAARGIVVAREGAIDPCSSCLARPVSVCNVIPESDLARLAAAAVEAEVPAGRTFINEGEPADWFFNVTAGSAKLFKLLPDGRRQITGFAGIGHFLGLAVSDTYAFTAEAMEPLRYCRFSRTRLRALLDDYPLMEKRLLEVAANELVAAQEQMLLLGRKTARERLAWFLMDMSERIPAPDRLELPVSRQDIADYLGLTIETVSRTMTQLQDDEFIALEGCRQVLMRDRQALQDLAA